MDENNQTSILGTTGAAGDPELTPEQIAEEAKAEEEFISAPEDTITNPLVPEEPTPADVRENTLEGAIGSGDLQTELPQENNDLVSNESNMRNDDNIAANEAPTESVEPITPAEPVAGPAPVEPVPAAETAGVSNVYEEPKKKGKKGLVIGLVVGGVVLIGCGAGAAVWAMMHESSENSVNDALANFFSAENIKISGTMSGKMDDDSGLGMGNYTLNMDGARSGKKISGNGTMKTKLGDKEIELKFSAAYVSGDDVYFKIDGVKDIMSIVSSGSLFGEDLSYMSSYIEPVISAVSSKIDGQWYKISASDIEGSDSFSCMTGGLTELLTSDVSGAISEAYKKNPVYKVDEKAKVEEKDGVKYYTVVVDEENEKAFKDSVKDIEGVKKLSKCSESSSSSKDKDNASSLKDATVQIGVKPWSHEFAGLKIKSDESEGEFTVKYEKTEIEAPSDAKSFSSIQKELEEAIQQALMQSILGGSGSSSLFGGGSSSLFGGDSSSLFGGDSSSLFNLDDIDDLDYDSDDYSDLLNLFN